MDAVEDVPPLTSTRPSYTSVACALVRATVIDPAASLARVLREQVIVSSSFWRECTRFDSPIDDSSCRLRVVFLRGAGYGRI
jgi:hypothetical protein